MMRGKNRILSGLKIPYISHDRMRCTDEILRSGEETLYALRFTFYDLYMRLKRLELQGFKSFAKKTTFDFPARIIGVVGPNGSGKSNIIDGLRWLLGEREAKNLRGMAVDDLIFSGTDSRTRVGLASVGLCFENTGGFFPMDCAEIEVSRKLFRDGTAQFFINNEEVRLKDLVDLFANARVGTRGLTIINQGNSDVLIKASPKERREMIEEVLGLRAHRLKRHEASLKLAATKNNLDKARVTMEELLPRLRLLRREVSRWEGRAQLEVRLREIEDQYFATKLRMLRDEESALAPRRQKIEETLRGVAARIRDAEARVKEFEASRPREDASAAARREKQRALVESRRNLERELGRLEAKLEFAREAPRVTVRSEDLQQTLKDVRRMLTEALRHEDAAHLRSAMQKCLETITAFDEGRRSIVQQDASGEINAAREKIQQELAALDEEAATLDIESVKFGEQLKGFTTIFRARFEELQKVRDEYRKYESEERSLQFEHERIVGKWQDIAGAIEQAGRRVEEFERAKGDMPAATFPDAERLMLRLRGELAAIGAIDQTVIAEAKDTESRHTFLKQQIDDLEQASADLEKLATELSIKIKTEFETALKEINAHVTQYFHMLFGGGSVKLVAIRKEVEPHDENREAEPSTNPYVGIGAGDDIAGLDISISVPSKGIKGVEMLSGGEKSLVSIAVLFALISLTPPPFLVLDEVDAALDEQNARRFAQLIKEFGKETQFIVVTHNRATMEAADVLYGVTMGSDGISKLLSVKLAE